MLRNACCCSKRTLLPRSGAVVLQRASSRLSREECSTQVQPSHWFEWIGNVSVPDSGDGGRGGDTLRRQSRWRASGNRTTVANHWHGLAQGRPRSRTAPANSEVVCLAADALREQRTMREATIAQSTGPEPAADSIGGEGAPRDSVAGAPAMSLHSSANDQALPDEYDEIARIWMNSWVSTRTGRGQQFPAGKTARAHPDGDRKRLEPPRCRRWRD